MTRLIDKVEKAVKDYLEKEKGLNKDQIRLLTQAATNPCALQWYSHLLKLSSIFTYDIGINRAKNILLRINTIKNNSKEELRNTPEMKRANKNIPLLTGDECNNMLDEILDKYLSDFLKGGEKLRGRLYEVCCEHFKGSEIKSQFCSTYEKMKREEQYSQVMLS